MKQGWQIHDTGRAGGGNPGRSACDREATNGHTSRPRERGLACVGGTRWRSEPAAVRVSDRARDGLRDEAGEETSTSLDDGARFGRAEMEACFGTAAPSGAVAVEVDRKGDPSLAGERIAADRFRTRTTRA